MITKWDLFDGARIEHLCGQLYILSYETRTDGFPYICVANGMDPPQPISADLNTCTAKELRAVAEWLENKRGKVNR